MPNATARRTASRNPIKNHRTHASRRPTRSARMTTVQAPGTIQFFTGSNTGLLCASSWCYSEPGSATIWNVVCEPSSIVTTQGILSSCTNFAAKSNVDGQCLTNYGDGQVRILACPDGFPPEITWSLQSVSRQGNATYQVLSSKPGTGNGFCMLSSGFVGQCASGPSFTDQWLPTGTAMTPLPIPAPPLSSQTIGIIVGVVCGVLALLAIGCGIMWWKRKKARGDFDPKDKELPTIEGLESKAVAGTPKAAQAAPKPVELPVAPRDADYNSIPMTPVAAGNAMYDSFVPPPRGVSAAPHAPEPVIPSTSYAQGYTYAEPAVMNVSLDAGTVIPKRQTSTRAPASYSAEAEASSGPGTVIGNSVVALHSPASQSQPFTIQLGQIYVAKLTYYQTLNDEITALSGERLKVLDMWDDGWMRAENLTTRTSGMLPCSVITGEQAQ